MSRIDFFYFNPFHFRDSTFQNAVYQRLNGPIWIITYTHTFIWTKSGNFHGIFQTKTMTNATKFVLFFPLPVKLWSCRMLRLRIVNLSSTVRHSYSTVVDDEIYILIFATGQPFRVFFLNDLMIFSFNATFFLEIVHFKRCHW